MKAFLNDMDQRPTEGQIIKEIIISFQERGIQIQNVEDIDAELFALELLKELVEPIDNANDLDKMGGLDEVLKRVNSEHEKIRIGAYNVIGVAASNNDVVQKQILEKGGIEQLVRRAHKETSLDSQVKILYAIGVVARYGNEARQILLKENLTKLLFDGMNQDESRIRRKALLLMTDLLSHDPDKTLIHTNDIKAFIDTIVSIVSGAKREDLDLREKALLAVEVLMKLDDLKITEILSKSEMLLALDKFSKHLKDMIDDEDSMIDYLTDLQNMIRSLQIDITQSSQSLNSREL